MSWFGRAPAEIGMPLEEVDTPALIVELEAFEANLRRMAGEATMSGVRLRPHAKTHKSSAIALQQIALGAVGVCCQKVSEAEALVEGGVADVLISNEIIDPRKIDRLVALAPGARVSVCVDSLEGVTALNTSARQRETRIGVLVEVDVGGNRCGVDPGEPARKLAEQVASSSHLDFRGLQGYQGRAQHMREWGERKSAIDYSVAALRETVDLLARQGLQCEIIAGAGTGTYPFEMESGLYNELQPGSYIFMDADYRSNLAQPGTAGFRQSLFVYTQVMSNPGRHYAIVDAGLKAIAFDSGMPIVADLPGLTYGRPSDEHGMLDLRNTDAKIELGTKLKLIPGHCDPTANLYDWYVAVRDGRVESLWPIDARAALR